MEWSRKKDNFDLAVIIVGLLVVVVLSLMTTARPPRRTMLQLVAPVPTLTKEQRWDELMDELFVVVGESDRAEVWRVLGEIDELLGKRWPPPVQFDVICPVCLDCGKDDGAICNWCRKHSGKYAHTSEGAG